jgi:hypothetical protein
LIGRRRDNVRHGTGTWRDIVCKVPGLPACERSPDLGNDTMARAVRFAHINWFLTCRCTPFPVRAMGNADALMSSPFPSSNGKLVHRHLRLVSQTPLPQAHAGLADQTVPCPANPFRLSGSHSEPNISGDGERRSTGSATGSAICCGAATNLNST